MKAEKIRSIRQARRVRRVRKKIAGTPECPRLCVSRSHCNIIAQLIDDTSGRILCSTSTRTKELGGQIAYGGNKAAATTIGQAIGEKAKSMGIAQVCFDRRGRKYHGRIKALADAAREAGLKF